MPYVAEKFISINGEGQRAGELAVFLRFAGCNLNCSYCDTKWANLPDTKSEYESPDELVQYVSRSGVRNVTLTGGEPLLQKDIEELVKKLVSSGSRVEIETNGSISIAQLASAKERPVFTMDYKLPSSGMESFMLKENFKYLTDCDTVKFVSGSIADLDRTSEVIREYSLTERCRVYISPVFGMIDPADIVEYMKENDLNDVRLQLQLHKFIWDPEKRGV